MRVNFFFFFLMFFFTNICAQTPQFPSGSGTESDPYLVENWQNLYWMNIRETIDGISYSEKLSKHYKQTADIIFPEDIQNWDNGQGWNPLGAVISDNESFFFSGSYDGQGYLISGLFINRPELSYQGFIGYSSSIENPVILKNITLINVMITANNFSGLLAGRAYNSLIENCQCFGTLNANEYAGLLSGEIRNSCISNSLSNGFVNGNQYLGILTGYSAETEFSNCFYNYDTSFINNSKMITIGAIYGEMFDNWNQNNRVLNISDYFDLDEENNILINNIEDLKNMLGFSYLNEARYLLVNDLDLSVLDDFYIPYFRGLFNGNEKSINQFHISQNISRNIGFFGEVQNSTIRDLNISNSNVTALCYAGIISASMTDSFIENCSVSGNITATQYAGGITGYLYNSEINHCNSECVMTVDYFSGGIAGDSRSSVIDSCVAFVEIQGEDMGGGIVGCAFLSTISNSNSSGLINNGTTTGGLAGSISHTNIEKCFSNVTVNSELYAGGLCGVIIFNSNVNQSFSNCQVTGNDKAGGFSGYIEQSTITDCYSLSNVTGTIYIGGYAGLVNNTQTNNVFSSGQVSGIVVFGGFIGRYNSQNISNSFWDIQSSNASNAFGEGYTTGVLGKDTEEMKISTTYTDYNWDFTNIWQISPQINSGYPSFKWQGQVNTSEDQSQLVKETLISHRAYPNPFNPAISICFELSISDHIEINIYNIKGQKIVNLADKKFTSGTNQVNWDGKDLNGKNVSAGIYFYQIKSKDSQKFAKIILLK